MKMLTLSSQLLAIHQCKEFLLNKGTAGVVATIRAVTNIKPNEYSVIRRHTHVATANNTTTLLSFKNYFPSKLRTIQTTTKMSNTSDDIKIHNYYNVALEIVMKCGPLLREGYGVADADYKQKTAAYDLVTVYDKKVEDILVDGLQTAFPESKFIGEESASESGKLPELTDAPTWIIDPIDGTTNFIHRIPHWCISVGLAINRELVVGIVYNPIANEMYSAWKGHGAYLNGQRIHVRKCTEMNDAVLAFEVSIIHAASVRDKYVKRLSKLAAHSAGTRCMGSAALTLCYVASGCFDCYHVEDLMPWDIAAGAVILREAGGLLYHSKGGEFNIMKPDLTAATSPELVKIMVGLIEEADALAFTFK
ncbi:inositol monophosphatase 2-like [Bactrocera tryoni]|uniref:inositol monophosphatase 2-like n=1 Tax=Bactrocera tryoni TaxID=59916 RepID=UPI001A98DF13|nr:inositol monophosphatase 2-like [Bactrocera tryoni]